MAALIVAVVVITIAVFLDEPLGINYKEMGISRIAYFIHNITRFYGGVAVGVVLYPLLKEEA